MRVTHNMLTRNYLRNLNRNMSNLAKSNEKMNSQRKFNVASEDVAGANRALRVRRQLASNEQSMEAMRDIQGTLEVAEDNLRAVNGIMQNVNERIVQSLNGTVGPDDMEKIAREVTNLQEQLLQISNLQYNGKYVFASTGNKTGSAPFTVGADGALSYNGTPVDNMVAGTGADKGKIFVGVAVPPALPVEIPYNGKNFVDIGLGFTVGANGVLDTKTALQNSISGVEAFGFGTSADGVPGNLYSLLGKVAADMRAGDTASLGLDLEHMKTQTDNLLMNIADIGNRMNFISQTTERMENDTLNLQKVQNDLEAVPLQEEIIYNKDYEMSWMVTLQMGAKVLPASIFDFMR